MPGDYSRKTFNRKKHYRGVLMQQGRVQLDADWNEQLAIQLYRDETEAKDVIGLCGAPKSGDAFKITSNGSDLLITPGRIYVGGLLCELEMGAQTTYANQPYYPNPEFTSSLPSPPASPLASPPGGPQLKLDDGVYLAYIDAWQREITALDDPLIREKALGGPDTAARLQSVWQVRLLRVATNSGNVTCKTPLPEYLQRIAAGTGKMTAQTKKADDPKDPCLLPPKAGYLRLENQLYRVEVHKGGDRSEATFKWSRDNATVETTVNTASGSLLTVSEVGKDETLAFRDGDWLELVTEEAMLKHEPFPLAQIDHVDPATREITLKTPVPAKAADAPRLKLRRWDQTGADATADGVKVALANMIDLEGGVQVGFSAGSYRSGDYWLIPARTVTGEIEWPPFEIPNNNPQAQLPFAVKHHYCRLALVEAKGGVISVKEDCRKKFPPLTEICAEDVCFDNDNCKMPGVETVQEALDRLCAARDLRHHNKHLHGWGIVCGLQVECGPDGPGQPRTHVTVRKGYAIDCEGNDVILDNDEKLDLAAISAGLASPLASPLTSPPTGLADGELALFIDLDEQQQRRFRVERYTPPKNDWQSLLKGTLLADFINECILNLAGFFKEEFTVGADEAKLPVGPARKRLTTLLNLIVQLANPTNGSFVFISREEDKILRDFYFKLRALLQSHTFCAMFDGARQFPERYPFPDQDIITIFGKGSQQRLRVAPNGRVAYAVGSGSNKIAVYDLAGNEMAAELEFPGGSNALVQDVAFSESGRELYAVATINDKDTSFAVADVIGLNHVWRQPTVVCDALLVTLATAPNISSDVYAVGKGKGLFQINPQNVNATPTPMGNRSFAATGHLTVFAQEGVAYAAASEAGAAGQNRYTKVVRVDLRSPTNNLQDIQLQTAGQQAQGQDDIALSFSAGQRVRLYVVVDPPSGFVNKQVMIFDAAGGNLLAQRDLGEANTDIRLAFNGATNRMAVAYEESYRLAILNADDVPEPNFRFPVQISPLSIAVAPDNKRVYVLNFASNTVSSISAGLLDPNRRLSMNDLVDYRTAVLNALFDLAGGFFQYLKDCLCDHFLVNCPTCDSDDKLYLAVISVKNNQVHKVCNFSLRKYVKSFPTVEYWLSLVPILPLAKKAVESFCCSVLPDFFGRRNAPRAQVVENQITLAPNRVKSSSVRSGVQFVKTTDIRSVTREGVSKVASSRPLLFDAVTKGTRRTEVLAPGVRHSDIAGQPVDEAHRKLEAAKINVVKVEPYDPGAGLDNLIEFTSAPLRLEEGSQIKLITRDNKVLFYARMETESRQIRDLREEVAAASATIAEHKTAMAEAAQLRSELSALKNEMKEMEKKHQEAISSRDKELQSNIRDVKELKELVAKFTQDRKTTRLRKKEN
jgi:DNA-binding beta-propeller fold protein YncE